MALPKIDVPTYDVTVPSTGQIMKVRPFNVKEEKLLLIAVESKNADDIISTVKQVINNCIIESEVDINKLPFFDVDYIFIFLRAKSIGNSVDIVLTCNNMTDSGVCGNQIPSKLDISKVDMIKEDALSDDIKLDKTKGVKLKYPNYATMKRIEFGNPVDAKTNIIINSIDYIYDKNGIYSSKDHSKEELKEFIESLTEENYKKMEAFVDNFPSFAVVLEENCPKCGFHHRVRYTDFYDFFF